MATATKTASSIWEEIGAHPIPDPYSSDLDRLIAVCHVHLPRVDDDAILLAFRVSSWAHRNDTRASGEPYIVHPLAVARIVAEDVRFDDISVVAALLHDVVEDNSDVTIDHIRDLFGDTIAKVVDGLTKLEHEFENRALRQAENFRKLLLSMASDIRVILVKFADRLHNMRTLGALNEKKQFKIASETLELFAPLSHRFGLYSIKNELEDLSLKIINPEAYYDISRGLNSKKRSREAYVKRFIGPVRKQLKSTGFDFDIYGRPKHIYSIYRKMRKQDKGLDEIYDLFAIRIILHSEGRKGKEDCWRVYSIITDLYQPLPERFRDFISVPKSNGYQSLHTTVIGPDGKRVEVQIRTRNMHEIAEMGVAAHWKYKDDSGKQQTDLDKQYSWVRELLDNSGMSGATDFVNDFQADFSTQEIYVFTPNGDLMTLPQGATPVDFAYKVHTQVGFHCSGAKVNSRVVPLSYQLKSGDQVAILTSKNKKPNPDWMKFVVTHKARTRIRHWLNEEHRETIRKGRELWDKKAKKAKLEVDEQDLHRYANTLNFPNTQQMFYEIGQGLFDIRELVQLARNGGRLSNQEESAELQPSSNLLRLEHERFLDQAQTVGKPALLIDGTRYEDMATSYAPCCNPIPGDPVFGYVGRTGGIKIHRKTCVNAPHLIRNDDRVVPVAWSRQKDLQFMSALRIVGEDRVGLISDMTELISKTMKTNIRSISGDTQDGVFEGTIVLDVNDLSHLRKLMERLRKVNGIFGVYRFEE